MLKPTFPVDLTHISGGFDSSFIFQKSSSSLPLHFHREIGPRPWGRGWLTMASLVAVAEAGRLDVQDAGGSVLTMGM